MRTKSKVEGRGRSRTLPTLGDRYVTVCWPTSDVSLSFSIDTRQAAAPLFLQPSDSQTTLPLLELPLGLLLDPVPQLGGHFRIVSGLVGASTRASPGDKERSTEGFRFR